MKQIITFLLVILSLSLNAQNETDIISQLNELAKDAGKVYLIWSMSDSSNTDTTYIAIVPDVWETYSFKVGHGFSPNGQTTFEVSPINIKTVKRGVSTSTIKHYKNNEENINVEPIAFVEVPARYVSFKPISIIENGNRIITIPTQKVEARRLVKKGGLKYVSKQEAMKMDKNDVYILVGQTGVREHISIRCYSIIHKIKDIQSSLNEKGYKCPIDGVLGQSTKTVLLQFQKDNNLPQGRLDIETLKALDVQ